jgi:CHAT domain-containing protein
LPFGILVRQPTGPIADFDYRNVDFVAKDMSVSLLPSVRSFADLRDLVSASHAPQPFIGFGDFRPHDTGGLALGDSCESQQLALQQSAAPLPESANEIARAAHAFSARHAPLITGNDFTENAVETSNLSDYRVVYFATHGLLPTDLQCELQPALLTSVGTGDNPGDGFLTASEILNLHLDADLIVLSACNTGGGDGRGGESLSGLARSFFYAGARAMLVSHWFVESDATVRTMTELFQKLGQGTDTADALRDAQLEILDDAGGDLPVYWSHPLYWGAFSLVGDGERTIQPGAAS